MQDTEIVVPSNPALTSYWGNFNIKTLARVNLSFMPLYDMLERNHVSFGDVASFGAGSCTHETAIGLIWPSADIHCYDVTDSYIPEYTKRIFEQRPNLKFHEWDATQQVDEQFDLVISIQTLEHIADYAAALATLVRAVRPGGYLYVDTPQFHEHEEREPGLDELWERARNYHHHEHLGFSGLQMRRRLQAHGLEVVDAGFY